MTQTKEKKFQEQKNKKPIFWRIMSIWVDFWCCGSALSFSHFFSLYFQSVLSTAVKCSAAASMVWPFCAACTLLSALLFPALKKIPIPEIFPSPSPSKRFKRSHLFNNSTKKVLAYNLFWSNIWPLNNQNATVHEKSCSHKHIFPCTELML